MAEAFQNQDSSQSVTWEDVLAVAKIGGVKVEQADKRYSIFNPQQVYAVYNWHNLPTYHGDPKSAMDEVVLISKSPEAEWVTI